jgi:SnoaL-like domain
MSDHTHDMLAIGQVLARYCRGVDRLDAELLTNVFWPESYDDHGMFQGGRSEFVDWVIPAMRDQYSLTNFMLGQSYFEFRGDRAAVETHFSGRGWGFGGSPELFGSLCGRYADLFEKRGGEWRILRRTVIYDGYMAAEAVPQTFRRVEGMRSHEDRSYHIFDDASAAPRSGKIA